MTTPTSTSASQKRLIIICSSIVGGVLLLVIGAAVVSNLMTIDDAPIPSQDPETLASGATEVAFDEFSFEMPGGWTKVEPDTRLTKAMLLLGHSRWNRAKGMIKVDSGTPTNPTQRATAEDFARTMDGQIDPDPVLVENERGVKVAGASTTFDQPREVIVVHRNGKAYLLMAGGLEGVNVSNALEHVRKTWKWRD